MKVFWVILAFILTLNRIALNLIINLLNLLGILDYFDTPIPFPELSDAGFLFLVFLAALALILDFLERKNLVELLLQRKGTSTDMASNEIKTHFYSDILLPKSWVDKSGDSTRLFLLLRKRKNLNQLFLNKEGNAPPKVIEIQALGGSGKSCFVRKFIDEKRIDSLNYRSRIWFSFYKLKSTYDPFNYFVDFALDKLDPTYKIELKTSTEAKRIRLENILRVKKYLIILDGFEVLQVQNDPDNRGRIPDSEVEFKSFLKSACNFPESQIIITTREHLIDLRDSHGFYEFKLTPWTSRDLQSFLGDKKIVFNKKQLDEILNILGAHPLTLTAFKFLFHDYYEGDVSKISKAINKRIRPTKCILEKQASAYNFVEAGVVVGSGFLKCT